MTHTFYLQLGDWSNDGHGRCDDVYISCSHEFDDVIDAYERASKKYGIDITRECEEYEDNVISTQFVDKYLKVMENHDPDYVQEKKEWVSVADGWWSDPDDFVDIYMRIVELELPDMLWEHLRVPNISIGGYGLYGS